MSPAQLLDAIRSDPARAAEVEVYDALERQLGDEYTVFYSVEWNAAPVSSEPVQDGEADFVVGHPKHGFLVLEVKGGIVAFDPEQRRWTSTSRGGYTNKITDPFGQAKRSCYGLVARIQKLVSERGSMRLFHGVVLPHCLIRPEDLPGAASPRTTIDAGGLSHLEQSIEQAFEYWANGVELRGPGYGEVLRAIRRIHSHPVAGYRNMSLEIVEHHAEFDRLTDDQLRVLDMVAANRRLLVRGCAGSGKTFLAKRLAAKRSSRGERVLTVCFNNLLGNLLEEELGGLPRVTATNFHRLCERLAQGAGMALTPPAAENASVYYTALLDAALAALDSDPSLRFDTVIVDEAQDFELEWWIVIEALLSGEDASLTVFTDANQLLYGTNRGVPDGYGVFAEIDLGENVRNTQAIHREALRFFRGETVPTALGPEGVAPTWIEAESPDAQIAQLELVLGRLIDEQRIATKDVAVLTPKGVGSTSLNDLQQVGKWDLSAYELREDDEIGWSTIRRFKGLESPVVILVELDDAIAQSDRLRELVYVGISRARDFLYLIGSSGTLTLIRTDGKRA